MFSMSGLHLASHKELNIKWLNNLTHHKEHHRLENGNNLGFITSFWDRVFNITIKYKIEIYINI